MKNKILKSITGIIAVLFILAASAIDSNTYIPHIICAVSEAWIVLFLIANRKAIKSWGRRQEKMCYIPDFLDHWSEHNRQQEEAVKNLPECCECGEPIQDDYCFEINDEIICEKCLMENFRKSTEDLVM